MKDQSESMSAARVVIEEMFAEYPLLRILDGLEQFGEFRGWGRIGGNHPSSNESEPNV